MRQTFSISRFSRACGALGPAVLVLALLGLSASVLAGTGVEEALEQTTGSSVEEPASAEGQLAPQDQEEIEILLIQAERAVERGWLISPQGRSAADHYAEILRIDAHNPAALAGLSALQRELVDDALELAQALDYETAGQLLRTASDLHADPLLMAWASNRLSEIRQSQLVEAEQAILDDLDAGRFDAAEERLTELVALGMQRERVEEIRGQLASMRLYGPFEEGQVFADRLSIVAVDGPLMVVIPAGNFMKGSPDSESGRHSNEGPRYRVTFARGFALAQTETTVGQFALFVEQTGYQSDAERRGWSHVYEPRSGRMTRRNRINWRHDYLGRDATPDLPVIHVSWRDAAAYAAWLAQQTGEPYRLPSEAEFEYALRAGSQTRFWWGEDSPVEAVENVTGDGDLSPTNSRWSVAFPRYSDGFWGPAPVGALQPNPFGLYDLGGNVMEWTEDCWHDSFVRAPVDGSAWVNPGCSNRVIRGGSWSSTPDMSRSAYRISGAEDSADMRVGFRVARDLW